MPTAGKVLVKLSPEQCNAAARWLRGYRPAPPTLLVPEDTREADNRNARLLSRQLAKAARRRTGPIAGREIDRQLASWFGGLDAVALRGVSMPPPVVQAIHACRDATAAKRRGRRTLQRSEETLTDSIKGDDDRYLRKMRRRARYQRTLASWWERLLGRGETVLTSSEPRPRK